jgi:tetratricopeptide (TPR) repeat protein
VLLFVTGVLAATAAVLVRPVLRSQLAVRTQEILDAAQEALEQDDLPRAADLAREALTRRQRASQPTGSASLALGLTRARQAEHSDGADRLVYLAAATQHLADAIRDGVPFKDEPNLYFQLARCLHARNQLPESIRLLRQSLVNYPDGRVEALRLLTVAYLDPLHLDLTHAYEANAGLIQEPGLSDENLAWGWRTRRDILRQLGKPDLMAGIELGAEDQRWVGLMARACDHFVDKEFAEASALLVALAKLKGLTPHAERRIWYFLGLASRENGDNETALGAFRQIEWRHPDSPEAVAAAAFIAAILLDQGQYEQAIVSLNRAARVPESAPGSSLPIEGPSLARLLNTAVHKLRERQQYEQAAILIEHYRRVSPGPAANQLAIQLYESWAAARMQESVAQQAAEANQVRYHAEELYRKAGSLSLLAADAAQNAEESTRWLWQAATHFVQGRGYLQAVAALEQFLDLGVAGKFRAQALALLCAALENSGKAELVPEVAQQCIDDFPDDPATMAARYYLARSMIGFGEFDQAELQLRAALDESNADADPLVIEQSRLVLAHLLCDRGREEEAIPCLNELIGSASDRDSLFDARLLLGDSWHRCAQRPAASAVESHTENAKLHYQHRKEDDLEQALKVFSTLQRQLAALDRSGQLTDLQIDWLRRCRWGMADCLYEADRVEEALELYSLLADVYGAPADWFAAQLQIANCHVRLNRIDTAVAVIRAAHVRLVQLPPDAREQVRVGMAPERWKEWLEWGSRM